MYFRWKALSRVPGDASIAWNVEKPELHLVRFLRLDPPWSITGPIWKRAALLKIGGFDEALPRLAGLATSCHGALARFKLLPGGSVTRLLLSTGRKR